MPNKLFPVLLFALFTAAPSALPQAAPSAKVAEAVPQATETQLLKLENIQLKLTILSETIQSIDEQMRKLPSEREATKKQQDNLSLEYGALIKKIESEHPGFHWDPLQRKLVAIPKPTDKAPVEKQAK